MENRTTINPAADDVHAVTRNVVPRLPTHVPAPPAEGLEQERISARQEGKHWSFPQITQLLLQSLTLDTLLQLAVLATSHPTPEGPGGSQARGQAVARLLQRLLNR